MSEIQPLIDLSNKLQEKYSNYSKLNWTSYTVGFDFGLDDAHKEMKAVLEDPKNFDLIRSHREKDLSAEDARRVEILHKEFEPYHLSKELNEVGDRIFEVKTKLSNLLNNFRNTIDGKEVQSTEISKILRTSEDREHRKKAYKAMSQINKPLVDGGFIELLNLRKEYAKIYGAKNFVELELKKNELSPKIFEGWRETTTSNLAERTKKRTGFGQKYLGIEQLMPWDEAHLGTKIAPLKQKKVGMINYYEPMKELFLKFGFDIGSKNITYDVFPRKNKSEWGYHFTISPGKDARILANIDDQYSHFWVLLHETGHAAHFSHTDPDDVIMNMGISGIISEGIANLFGYLGNEEIFYSKFFPNELGEAKTQFENAKEWSKINALNSVQPILFDQSLYLENLQSLDDINNLKWKMMKDLDGVERFDGEPNWGFLIHHTTHPIYLQNYFMGDVTCEMLKKSYLKQSSSKKITDNPLEFGSYLLENVVKPSGRYNFEQLFNNLSGDNFNLNYLIN
ncbi:MAG: peptidase M3A and M3B thimet/oligopeptidase F [Bacteriovoracaceae bacterium]|jgi:oligoendopeptidase F|nr:peptidase M3A and M3B thimet/oligopeptidase F [Bacteriovoracaceae bacterium]